MVHTHGCGRNSDLLSSESPTTTSGVHWTSCLTLTLRISACDAPSTLLIRLASWSLVGRTSFCGCTPSWPTAYNGGKRANRLKINQNVILRAAQKAKAPYKSAYHRLGWLIAYQIGRRLHTVLRPRTHLSMRDTLFKKVGKSDTFLAGFIHVKLIVVPRLARM
ncbi:hypothetical protein BDW68DRAFT_95857 [Aspergillus falconensis]